ncbi:sugar-binding domain-containing protein [Puia sp.]|uniref:sugar-binding domain-containing protein n=1 Tax=Puia sp. TaxID=2045100 RepID=UPI002F428C27
MKPLVTLSIVWVLAGITPRAWAQSPSAAQPSQPPDRPSNTLSLAGIWKFQLDPFQTGISSNGVQFLPRMAEEITLPGSTDQAAKGYRSQSMSSLRLTRLFEYKGAAWYEKEIRVPDSWQGKTIRLFLERAHWETAIWINDHPIGKRQSLSVPHIYDLTPWIVPGQKNIIRIRVDNNMIYNIEYSHAASAETQTDWNGIIGRIELQSFDKVHIGDVQVVPDLTRKGVAYRIPIVNGSKKNIKGQLRLSVDGQPPVPFLPFSGNDSLIELSGFLSLGDKLSTWDEFHPFLYRLTAVLTSTSENKAVYTDSAQTQFGMREFSADGTRFTINGRPTFIRGTVNSAEFPLTGYPDMDETAWRHIFSVCKDYGLNTMRFHSWCPPEAAFAAADQTGIYLQVENTDWRFTVGKDTAVNRYLQEEAARILTTYGNHPSFTMFCEGNELVGPSVNDFLIGLLATWKKDNRHLYTGSSGYPVVAGNQYNDFYGARPQHWKEGLNGRFNAQPLDTRYDYSGYVRRFTIPMITHEIGQWCVYPDFDQIPDYIGVLKPYNYELFRESLRQHGMADLAKRFTLASGRWQVLQKKEEIESYLRTPGMGGYHLLQLNDFPGQGTAPVGVVDDFWRPKFYSSGEEFRQFQSAQVPLLRTGSFTWTNDQEFTGDIDFANFGSGPVKDAVIEWDLQYPDGSVYAKGQMPKTTIPLGSPIHLGHIRATLKNIKKAGSLVFHLRLPGTVCHNQWELWVYPKSLPPVDTTGLTIAHEWTEAVKASLRHGAKVLLLADTTQIRSGAVGVFSGISWNTVWSGMPPDLLGILCDPAHPALASFPTSFHTSWQWWDIVRHSKPMELDGTPMEFRPLVQMIPDWNSNKKLGLLFEARVGKGRLLVSSIDLRANLETRPVAAQLLYSLEKYMTSDAFQPAGILVESQIDTLFKKGDRP